MALKAEIINLGCVYGDGMASRDVIIEGIGGPEKAVKVLVTNKLSKARGWCEMHRAVPGLKADQHLGLAYVVGPLRKEGTMGLLGIFVSRNGEGFGLAFEAGKTTFTGFIRSLLARLNRKYIYGTQNTLSHLELGKDCATAVGDKVKEMMPLKEKAEGSKKPAPNGAVDEELILQATVEAALCCSFGRSTRSL